MKIGITGISGLIGSRLAELARGRGHTVIGYSRTPRAPEMRKFTTEAAPDLTGCDAIVNLSGESIIGLWTGAKRRAIRDSRIQGTRRIVEAMRAMPVPPRVLINASGTGVYRDTGDQEAGEDFPHGTTFLAKLSEEIEAEAVKGRETGARVVMLRTGLVLSPRGGGLAAMLPIFRMGLGGRLGDGRQWMPWIHLDDEAALILKAAEDAAIDGPLNCVSPQPVRNGDFTRALAAALHRPAILPVPAFAIRTVFSGFGSELLESRRAIPAAALRAGFQFRFPALAGALADLLPTA